MGAYNYSLVSNHCHLKEIIISCNWFHSFAHAFANLPPYFYSKVNASPLASPYLVDYSSEAAQLVNLDPVLCTSDAFLHLFSGNHLPAPISPVAAVYSGHQFGVWAGQLGDGRAILLGDIPGRDDQRLELQLKGAGMTPYSRMGDGRAVLRSSIREYLCSEAMAGLGIPTTRALCLIGSDQTVIRETSETTAVLTRMAPSFVRFGSLEHWHANPQALKTLADYVIENFYPTCQALENPYQALLAEITLRTAKLLAQWQTVGFMHGVMNTDNMSILGLTLDYGPFGFMENYDPYHICNHSDVQGRYAYHKQPQVGHWNCMMLAQAMLPLIGSVAAAKEVLEAYPIHYHSERNRLLCAKLGLRHQQKDDDKMLESTLTLLHQNRVDFTLFFRRLGNLQITGQSDDKDLRALFATPAALDVWAGTYRARLKQENSQDALRKIQMDRINPKYILRNHLAHTAIKQAQNKDFSEIKKLREILAKPFDEQPHYAQYAALSPDWAHHLEVSCSS